MVTLEVHGANEQPKLHDRCRTGLAGSRHHSGYQTQVAAVLAAARRPGVIVLERDGRLLLIKQLDHAALAGRFAQEWGDQRFEAPQPHEAVVLAASRHDEGVVPTSLEGCQVEPLHVRSGQGTAVLTPWPLRTGRLDVEVPLQAPEAPLRWTLTERAA